jgi:beta-lactamase regulating signal transducer with metallopeptidase domain
MLNALRLPPSVLETFGWTLLHSLWQGTLIAALLFFVLLFLKKSQVRYVISYAALVLMLLVPVVTFGILFDKPTPSVATNIAPDISLAPRPSDVDTPTNVDALQTRLPEEEGQPRGVAPTQTDEWSWRQRLTNYLPYVVGLWLVGVVVLSLRLLLQWLYAERFKRKHTKTASADLQHLLRVLALRMGVSYPVRLLESSLVDAPTVIGFLKPVILLPTSALTGLTTQQLEAFLAHELAHIRRNDYLINILQSVIETLLFYHPAVWWVSSQIRVEREHCCDDVAVGVSGSAVVYAKALATLETLRSQPQLAMAASGISLVKRIRRLVAKPATRTRFPASWLISFSTLALLITGLGLWLYPHLTEAQTSPASLRVFDRNGKELTEEIAPHAFGMIKEELVEKLGRDALEQNLNIYSTIDSQAQLSANEASLNAEMPPGAQMAVVGIDPSTGGILAMVGEHLREEQEVGELNRASQSYRQIAHSFKPIVYATAFEQAGFTQATILVDEPTAFKVPGQNDYKPENHDNTFMGSMTVRRALDVSRSIPVVKTMEAVTPDAVVAKAKELGYTNLQPYWSLALGSIEATPLQHTAAFGSFANGGVHNEPFIINRVEDMSGNILFETTPVIKRVWSEQTAYLTLDLMHGNVVDEGAFSRRAAIDGRYIAGKTGTSNDQKDIWFVGMTPGIVATVWIGYDDNSSIPKIMDSSLTQEDGRITSSRQPIYIWHDFVEGALLGRPIEEYPAPEGITFRNIDLTTGEAGSTRAAFLAQVDESMTQPDVESSSQKSELESNDMFTMPFDNPQIYSEFGRIGSHVSLRASSLEAPVKAVQAGKVSSVSFLGSNDGYMVAVEHSNGFVSAYTNLQREDLPAEGQEVTQGEVIGYLGGGYLLPKDVLPLYIRNAEGRYIDPLEVLPVQDLESSSSQTVVWGFDPSDMTTDSRGSLALDVGDKYYLWATIKGIVKLSDDYTDLQSTQTRDSYLQLEERHGTDRKSIIVKKYGANPVEYLYTVNGQQHPFDNEAKKWYAYAFKYAITMPVQDYESSLTPSEKVAGRSWLSSSYSESYSLIFVSASDYAYLMGPTTTNAGGSVEVRNFRPEDTFMAINTAIHYAAHDLLADTPEAHDEKIKVFIRDMLENVNFQKVAFYRLLLLINEMQTKEAKAEIVNEILPLLRDESLIEQYRQFSKWLLESNRIHE